MTKKLFPLLLAGVAAMSMGSAAVAADLIIEQPGVIVDDYADYPVVNNWDGLYVGAFAGWGMGRADHTNAGGGPCGTDDEGCDVDMSGWLAGVTAGANFGLGGGPVVVGVAGDIAWAHISGTEEFDFGLESTHRVNWEGSVRGVLGFDAGAFMPYLTGGLAVANAERSSVAGDDEWASATHTGLTAGVGVQVAVAENISLDLQYRHSWYGEQEYDHGGAFPQPEFALETDRITAGVNLRF